MKTSFHVKRAIDGDSAAVGWLVERFMPLVESQVRLRVGDRAAAEDVEDIVQEVWLVVMAKVGKLRPQGGRLAPVLASYLKTTAIHKCNDYLRSAIRGGRLRAGAAEGPGPDDLPRETRRVISRMVQAESADRVRACLERMEEGKRTVLALRLIEGRTNQEIGKLLAVQPNTVAVRYRRALQELRDRLPEEDYSGISELWSKSAAAD